MGEKFGVLFLDAGCLSVRFVTFAGEPFVTKVGGGGRVKRKGRRADKGEKKK